jgi:CheY-like chemotaxis protein
VDLTTSSTRRHPDARPGRFVCLTVTDNGCGMESGVVQRIFEPFFTTKEVGKGTGLGLATVYAVVKQHRGWIEVQSEVRAGTTFKIFLPASDQAVTASMPPSTQLGNVPGGKETILLAEDEAALLELMSQALGRYHYNILTASSGGEALQVWEQHQGRIDLLLTDVVMPGGMTGRELAGELKKKNPALKVIYTSGFNSVVTSKDCNRNGDTVFLAKPYLPDDVAKLIRATLDPESTSRFAA